jgi:outer membrane protein TolC
LFNGDIWSIGAGLVQPVFRGGELTARRRAAIAAYDVASADYRQTVLTAFQNVSGALQSIEADARGFQARYEADQAARQNLALVEKQFAFGAASYVTLLTAQQQYQQTHLSYVQALAARFADTAALFQALGGPFGGAAVARS